MTFNLIKWSIISVVTGITQFKLPERYTVKYNASSKQEEYALFYSSNKDEVKKTSDVEQTAEN